MGALRSNRVLGFDGALPGDAVEESMADDPGPRLVLESSIRRATDPDLPALAEVHRASILEIAPAFYPPEVVAYWGREREIEGYRRGMADHGDAIFVAEAAHQPGTFL